MKTMTKHERRIASKLCAWFNMFKYKKEKEVQCTHSFEKIDFERQLAFEQTSGDPSSLSVVDVLLTTIDTRWFMQ